MELSFRCITIRLQRPIVNAIGTWTTRTCVRVQLRHQGFTGSGEATPLPGYSPDAADGVVAALRALAARPRALREAGSLCEWAAALKAAWPEATPSAWFALETAWLDVCAQQMQVPMHRLLGKGAATALPIALVKLLETSPPERWPEAAGTALAAGYRTFKIKLGVADFEREHAALCALRASVGSSVALRFDVNGVWTLEQARQRVPRLAEFEPELVEEPCRTDQLAALLDCGVPLAMDESLLAADALEHLTTCARSGIVRAIVLKPALLGGYTGCAQWCERARQLGLGIVLTHCFDGPIALAAACEIALALSSGLACGLDRYAALTDWPDDHVPQLQPPWLEPASIIGVRAPVSSAAC